MPDRRGRGRLRRLLWVPLPVIDVQRIYLKDLPEFERNGWKADRDADGKILIMHAPTGPQRYVARAVPQAALAGLKLETPIDWID